MGTEVSPRHEWPVGRLSSTARGGVGAAIVAAAALCLGGAFSAHAQDMEPRSYSNPVSIHNSIKLFARTGVLARTGNNFDLLGIAW